MADIDKELNDIKNAIYGKEVRGSIHDGIKKINEESEESKQKADEAHDVMKEILDESFDSAALEANFEQKLDDKIENLQTEWTQFKEDTEQNFDDVTTQLAENTNTNPVFKTNNTEDLLLGAELVKDGNVTLGAGWSGSVQGGFTHTPNNADVLTINIPSLKSNTIYQVEINVSNPDASGDGQSDFYVTLGNSPKFETYQG